MKIVVRGVWMLLWDRLGSTVYLPDRALHGHRKALHENGPTVTLETNYMVNHHHFNIHDHITQRTGSVVTI